jgi:hypothetical protein
MATNIFPFLLIGFKKCEQQIYNEKDSLSGRNDYNK